MDKDLTNDTMVENTNDLNSNGKTINNQFSLFSTNWKINVSDNQDVAVLYSRRSIFFFTVFCSIFFGGILMFLNLRKLKNRQGQLVVAIYSILYGVITWTILAQFERSTILTLMVSMFGSFALYNYFWGKYIGRNTEYKPKSIWIPLTIAIVSLLVFMVFVVANIESFK